jgi:sugar lactone lactonase YvrE
MKRFPLSAAICLASLSLARAQLTYEPYSFTTLPTTGAPLNSATGIAVDNAGNLYVANTNDHTILKINPAGSAVVIAGQSGVHGSANGVGTSAQFFGPAGIALDSGGALYVADRDNNTIRKISPTGEVITLAGSPGAPGSADGTGLAARFSMPESLTLDVDQNIIVADTGNSTIRKITPGGVVTTLAGAAGQTGSVDGPGTAARFYSPEGVAAAPSGNLFVTDSFNDTVRKIIPSGDVSTLGGRAGMEGSMDGVGCAARFLRPRGIAVDSGGTIYLTDYDSRLIRKITSGGVVTTLAGDNSDPFAGRADGIGKAARFIAPTGIAVDNSGKLFVLDIDRIRVGTAVPQSTPTTRTVTTTDDAGPGSLREAITLANNGDTINFAPGLNGQVITLTSDQLAINASITIDGPGANLLTVRRSSAVGTPAFRIFRIDPSQNVTISGLTIANGNAHGDPADAGGGIYNDESYLTVNGCAITGNTATNGGGICNHSSGPMIAVMTLTNSTFDQNVAIYGGGIFNGKFPDNNSSSSAAAILIANCTLSANAASNDGGGLYNASLGFNEARIFNCTFSDNTAPRGAGIETTAAYCELGNSIFKNGGPGPNITKDGSNPPLKSLGYNLLDDGANPTDPRLGPLQDNGGPTRTHAPLPDSPAIDRGKNLFLDDCNAPVPFDQRGFPRPVRFNPAIPEPTGGDGSDIGAVELSGPAPTLGNISTRLSIGTGEKVLIGGFIVEGSVSKKVLIRARGPSLAGAVSNPLPNPRLELHDATTTIANNNDWQTTQIGGVITAGQPQEIEDTGLAPSDPTESAIIATLPAGNYTAVIQDVSGASGVGIVEVFDLTPNVASRLGNISTRGFVQGGDNVMIGGIIVVSQPTRVIVRARGPSLTGSVSNPLPNPTLELHDQANLIARNDDWQTTQVGGVIAADQSQEIQNSGSAPANSAESAMIVTLQPGAYTAVIRDPSGASGIGIVEVFILP